MENNNKKYARVFTIHHESGKKVWFDINKQGLILDTNDHSNFKNGCYTVVLENLAHGKMIELNRLTWGVSTYIFSFDSIEYFECSSISDESVRFFLEKKGSQGVAVSAQDYSITESCLKTYRVQNIGNIVVLSKQCTGFYRYKYFQNDSTTKMGSTVSVS